MPPIKVMPLLLTGITPFVMVSGTARAAEPQIILAQAQPTPQQQQEEEKKQRQQQHREQGQPQQPQPRNAQGAPQPPQQNNAQEQQKALEQQRQQQRQAQEQQHLQQEKAAEQQQKALEQQQHLQQQKAAQEQQKALEQQRQQQRQVQEQQHLQQEKAAEQQKGLEQQRQQQRQAQEQQHLQQEKAAEQQKAQQLQQQQNAAQHQQELLKQQDAQRKALEDARLHNDQARIKQLQDQEAHTQQQLQGERQKAAAEQGQAQQQQLNLRRELSAEEQKARADRDAHQAERIRLIQQQQQAAATEQSQAAINERLRLQNERLQAITSERREVAGPGGQKYIQEPGNRTIFTVNNQQFIRHDETANFNFYGGKPQTQRGPGGDMITNIYRPDGSRIEVEVDPWGRPLRRVRYLPDGRRFILFENRPIAAGLGLAALGALAVTLPPPPPPPPDYIVDASAASEDAIYGALQAPPIAPLDRVYSLDEVLASVSLRERMRSISIDSIHFEFGSAEIGPDQSIMLESVAAAMHDMATRNPGEVFLIEGHTDAVGSDIDNLSLSDRRAQAVADVLSQQFGVPRENLVTQGYGKQFLLIPTFGPERRNRRVVVRRITPLLQGEPNRYSSGYGAPDGDAR